MKTSEPIDGTAADVAFIVTKEHRRFEEFCEACRQQRYIGLCYGPPGVGKTLSARHYAGWDALGPLLAAFQLGTPSAVPPDIATYRTLYYTPTVMVTPRRLDDDLGQLRHNLRKAVAQQRTPTEPPLLG